MFLNAQNTNSMHSNNLNFVFRKGMILLKQEDKFFPERKDLPLLEVTTKTGLWYVQTGKHGHGCTNCSNLEME